MQSSTARLAPILVPQGHLVALKKSNIQVPFNLDQRLTKATCSISTTSPLYPVLKSLQTDAENLELSTLTKNFERLCQLENDKSLKQKERHLIEQFKLAILKNFYDYLAQRYENKQKKEKPKQSKAWYVLKAGLFVLVGLFGIGSNGIEDFVYAESLFSLIPHMINPIMLIASGIFTVLNMMLFLSFEISLLKNMLGIESLGDASQFVLHGKQIKLTEKINQLLMEPTINKNKKINDVGYLSESDYQRYSQLAVKLNQYVDHLAPMYKDEYKEPWYKKLPRYGMTAFGAIMSMAGGYFMATSLLATILPFLVGTPPGWIIIGVSAISMLTLYFAMRGSGLSGMLNPLEEQFNQVKNKLKKFVLREEQDFKIAYANKVQLQSSVVTKPLPILRSNLQENTEQPIPRIDKARLRHSF